MWGAVLQEQAAPVWAPFSTAPLVLPEACPRTGSTWGHSLFQASTCSSVGSSRGCRWMSLHHGCPWAAGPQLPHTTGCRGISALAAPSLHHLPQCLQSCSSHVFSLLSSLSAISFFFFSFLNILSQRHYHHCGWAWPQPAAGWS